MLQDMLETMKLDTELRYGKDNSIGRIGRQLNYVHLPQDVRNMVVDKLQQWIREGKLAEVEKLISQINNLTPEEIMDLFSGDLHDSEDAMKLPMKWYKLSSTGLNRIKQLTTSGRLVTRIQSEDGEEVGLRDWEGESPSLITERHITANKRLFAVLDKTVEDTYMVFEQLKTEIVVIDVSASMAYIEKWMPVQLFLFNRIAAVERGEIVLKIILFGLDARRVVVSGEDTFTKDSKIKALERWVYNLRASDPDTRLDEALTLAKSCVNLKGKNAMTIFTDEGASFVSSAIPPKTIINTVCVEENYGMRKLTQQTGGKYYRFTDLVL